MILKTLSYLMMTMKKNRSIAIGDRLKDPEGIEWTIIGLATPGGDTGFMLENEETIEILPSWIVEEWERIW